MSNELLLQTDLSEIFSRVSTPVVHMKLRMCGQEIRDDLVQQTSRVNPGICAGYGSPRFSWGAFPFVHKPQYAPAALVTPCVRRQGGHKCHLSSASLFLLPTTTKVTFNMKRELLLWSFDPLIQSYKQSI